MRISDWSSDVCSSDLFHLERQTGGLSRVIERGTKGIEFVLRFMTFNILPTLVEIAMVGGILWWLYSWSFAAITVGTIVGYIVFTLEITEGRTKYCRQMNDEAARANTRATHTLQNARAPGREKEWQDV